MTAINSVQRIGWPVSASTLAAASKALRRLLSAAAGGVASVFVALAGRVLAGFFFLLAMLLLLENAGSKPSDRARRGAGTLSPVTSQVEQQSRQSCVEFWTFRDLAQAVRCGFLRGFLTSQEKPGPGRGSAWRDGLGQRPRHGEGEQDTGLQPRES